MTQTVAIEKRRDHILVRILGDLLTPAITDSLTKIAEIRRQHGITRILCDQREMGKPPDTMAIFMTASAFGADPLRGVRLAILRHEMPEGDHFFETVATNRGGIVRIFDDRKAALRWLRG